MSEKKENKIALDFEVVGTAKATVRFRDLSGTMREVALSLCVTGVAEDTSRTDDSRFSNTGGASWGRIRTIKDEAKDGGAS